MLTSRRDFLCTASAAAIAGLSAREVLAAEMKKAKPGVPAKWDMTTDVVVAGSGPSGMGRKPPENILYSNLENSLPQW